MTVLTDHKVSKPSAPPPRVRLDPPPVLTGIWKQKELALLVVDFLLVVAATSMVNAVVPSPHVPSLATSLKIGTLLGGLWVVLNWNSAVYERGLRGISAPIVRARSVARAGVWSAVGLIVATSIYGPPVLSVGQWALVVLAGGGAMLLVRVAMRRVDRLLARRGVVCQRIVIGGTDRDSREFAVRLRAHGSTVRLVGFLGTPIRPGISTCLSSPILGSFGDFAAAFRAAAFDALVLPPAACSQQDDRDTMMELLNFCEAHGIKLYSAPSSHDISVRRQEVASFSDVPLIMLQDASLHPVYGVVKRCVDVVGAGAAMLFGLPLWLAIAGIIKFTSPGPVLFVQTRIGLHGKPFRMYKFRSMVADAERRLDALVNISDLREPVFKIKHDPRVTPIGRFLRRTSLDEIPQLWNVLTGSMSLVGPRPEEERIVARYDPHQRRRLKAKPGITGLQQVECRGSQSLSRRITYDLIYMKHQGLLLDLYILLKTVVVVLKSSGTTH